MVQVAAGVLRVSTMREPTSDDETCRARQRQRQARYEARQRAGVALYPVPLGPTELNALVMLRWLPDAAVGDRVRVGEAVAVAFRDMVRKTF